MQARTLQPMTSLFRRAALGFVGVALLGRACWASPATDSSREAVRYWPFHPLARGAASCRDLGLPGRGVTVLCLPDQAALQAFWTRAHRYRPLLGPAASIPRLPAIDFGSRMAVAVIGRAGSADIRVRKMWTLPREQLVAGVFNPVWPDIAMDPQRVPYEILVASRSARTLLTYERPSAQALAAISLRARAPLALPPEARRGSLDDRIRAVRAACVAKGMSLLRALGRAPTPRHNDPEEPYLALLRASILERFLDRPKDAQRAWRGVIALWPGSLPARLAKSRLVRLERRSRDLAAWSSLEARRHALQADPRVSEGHARRWSELGQQYEYLVTQPPVSLFAAARCYAEAARDPDDADTVQNALLQAAALYAQEFDPQMASRLCWQCVTRYPDAASVPRTLAVIGELGWERRQAHADRAALQRFLRTWPQSRNAPAVRRMLARLSAPHP